VIAPNEAVSRPFSRALAGFGVKKGSLSLDPRTPDRVRSFMQPRVAFDAVGDGQVGAGVSGLGVGELGAERGEGSTASWC
jgi:hypothetical protein